MKDYLQLLSQIHQISDYGALVLETVSPLYSTIHLLDLIFQEEMNQKTLAKRLGMTEPALSMKLKNLEKDGYVIKVRSKKDKRHYILELTESGKNFVKENEGILNQQAKTLFHKLSNEEVEMLSNLLMKLEVF